MKVSAVTSVGSVVPPFLPELLLIALAVLCCLADLGGDALRDWDEATYATVAREGYAGGSWTSLHLEGQLFADKPPLMIWCIQAAYRLFGVSEFSARLPTALFGIAGVVLTYLIARRLGGVWAARLAALILLTAPQWLRYTRQAMLDVPLATCLAAAFLGSVTGSWPLLGFGLGAALMAKGPAALIALPALCVWLAAEPQRLRQALRGLLLALMIAAPWHVWQFVAHGHTFAARYIGFNVLGRLSTSVEGHEGPWWFYLDYVFGWESAWHWLGAAALVATTYRAVHGPRDGGRAVVLAWFWSVLVVFTAAPTKLPWYVIPVYPALAVITACWLAEAAGRRRWLRATVGILAIATPLLAVGKIASHRMRNDDAEATRTVLRSLPPRAESPVLLVSETVPLPSALFYARREVRRPRPGEPLQPGVWLLTNNGATEPHPKARVVSASGSRALLGPG